MRMPHTYIGGSLIRVWYGGTYENGIFAPALVRGQRGAEYRFVYQEQGWQGGARSSFPLAKK